jgi:hypothetical protein
MKHLLAGVLVLTSLPTFCQIKDRPEGHIKGTVTDRNGNPVASATVYVIPQAIAFEDITPRSVESDSNGEFDFHGGFALGIYKIYSRKEAESYPDPSDKFYANPKIETAKADLTDDHPSATITVGLGEKAAVLEGKVLDAASGKPKSARLIFLDEEGSGHSVFTDGKYRVLLPPGKDLTVMAVNLAAEEKPQLPVSALRLDSGQVMQMDISVSKQ